MADFKTRAALEAGKDAVKRVYEDLTLSDEEKARREEERAAARQKLKWKLIIGAVLVFVVVIALMALLAKFWLWIVGLAIVAALGVAGYYYVKPKLTGVRVREVEAAPEPKRVDAPQHRAASESERTPSEDRENAARAAREAVEAAAARERAIDDELAALKAKAGKPR